EILRWTLSPCLSGPFFFFQAEDGIRDRNVTGVQTCALPISAPGDSERPTAQSSGSVQWDALRGQHGSGDVRAVCGPLGVLLAVAGPLVRVDAELPGGGDVVLAVVEEDHRGGDGHSPGLMGERLQQDLVDPP